VDVDGIHCEAQDRVIDQAVSHWFDPKSDHLGFVVDKAALHRLLHTQHYRSSRVRTIVQIVADVPSSLSLTQPRLRRVKEITTRNLRKGYPRLGRRCCPLDARYGTTHCAWQVGTCVLRVTATAASRGNDTLLWFMSVQGCY
jgi:hypothetical protein